MELLVFVFLWPFIILTLGLIFIALGDTHGFYGSYLLGFVWPLAIITFLFWLVQNRRLSQGAAAGPEATLHRLRKFAIIFSLTLLLPLFTRYLLNALGQDSLLGILLGLLVGFGAVGLGMFVKEHRVLTYSNVLGGALVLLYVYGQLWQLGQLTRIIAAAVGLIVAIIISIIKLRERLT